MSISTNQHIDAVITWVDGNDPAHREKRKKMALLYNQQPKSRSTLSTADDETRFIENGELKYCLASIRTYAPWINKIFLVTDNQIPAFLTPELQKKFNVQLVDHTELFAGHAEVLPTFNSRSIESMLWTIKGLSSRFIYFNDDFILTDHCRPEHFFQHYNIVLRGRWKKIPEYGNIRLGVNQIGSYLVKNMLGITRSMHHLLQIRSARLAGYSSKYFRTPHVPHPVYKEAVAAFFNEHKYLLKKNIEYPFRNMNQFSGIFLAHHLMLKENNAVTLPPDNVLMLNGETDYRPYVYHKLKKIERGNIRFLCLQGYEFFPEQVKQRLHSILLHRLNEYDFLKLN